MRPASSANCPSLQIWQVAPFHKSAKPLHMSHPLHRCTFTCAAGTVASTEALRGRTAGSRNRQAVRPLLPIPAVIVPVRTPIRAHPSRDGAAKPGVSLEEIVRLPKLLTQSPEPHPVRLGASDYRRCAPPMGCVAFLGICMTEPKLLLMAPQRDDMITIGRALRDAGYLVFPARLHELGADAVTRVQPDLVLIDLQTYEHVASPECREAVRRCGSRILLFARLDAAGDGATMQRVAELPYPVVEYSGDARALAALLTGLARP